MADAMHPLLAATLLLNARQPNSKTLTAVAGRWHRPVQQQAQRHARPHIEVVPRHRPAALSITLQTL